MTKIKIIGNPGKQPVETLKEWLEEALRRFNLSSIEVWLVFFTHVKEFQKYTKGLEVLSPQEKTFFAKMEELKGYRAGYLHEIARKERIPPIILLRRSRKIFRENLFHEIAHLREERDGWVKIKIEAEKLLDETRKLMIWPNPIYGLLISHRLIEEIDDFFVYEKMCQYGLLNEVIREKKRKLQNLTKGILSSQRWKIQDFLNLMPMAFRTTSPPSYLKREEAELEGIVIDCIRRISMEIEYQKMKAAISQLTSPPKVNNIYKCGVEILELAQDFLENE